MNAATLIAILAAHSPASHVDDTPQRALETCPAHVVASFGELDDALRHLQHQLNDVRQRDQRRHLQGDLDKAQAAMQQARVVACRAARDRDVVVVQPAPPPPPPRPIILTAEGAHDLTHAVRREAFDDSRLAVLTLGVRGVCVTSEQSKSLVGELLFSNRKLDALRALAPRIVDRERAYVILEAFLFESDKRTARDILNGSPVAADCVMPRRA